MPNVRIVTDTRDADVAETLSHECQDLVFAEFGNDLQAVSGEQVLDLVLIRRQTEEVVLLIHL